MRFESKFVFSLFITAMAFSCIELNMGGAVGLGGLMYVSHIDNTNDQGISFLYGTDNVTFYRLCRMVCRQFLCLYSLVRFPF
jgi:hypothetical protein